MFTKTLSIVSLAAVAAFGVAQPVFAADFAARSVTVSYADLNLASVAGQDRLDARIRRAAASVCGANAGDLATTRAGTACRTAAAADAQAQLATVVAFNDRPAGGALIVRAR